jgi:D-3-phosphoglycerate dehydrogenase
MAEENTFKVMLTDGIGKAARDILEGAGMQVDVVPTLPPADLPAAIAQYDAVVVRSATKLNSAALAQPGKLKIIGRAGAGVDNIDLPAAKERGIAVVNSPAGNSNAVAEHTIGLMLALARHVHRAHASMKAGVWEKKLYMGTEVRGKTLGVIGLGKIGRLVASGAKGLGMEVTGYDPFVTAEQAASMGIKGVVLDALLSSSDYITIHVPLTDKTMKMIGPAQFAQMKNGARILNVARGGLIDEEALYDAIVSGKVAGAALDVWESEPPSGPGSKLLMLDQVLATPHLGGSTHEAQENVALDVARNIAMFLTEGKTEQQCRVA